MNAEVSIVGVGVVGGRAAREIVSGSSMKVALGSERADRRAELARVFGRSADVSDRSGAVSGATRVVVLSGDDDQQVADAGAHLDAGRHVVTTVTSHAAARGLVDLNERAVSNERALVVGAGFSPGLTDVLTAYAGARFDTVEEVHVARHGSAGPRCAEATDRALVRAAHVLHDGGFERRSVGGGRQLCWFPDPIGGRDAFYADTAEPLIAQLGNAGVVRASARITSSALRRVRTRLSWVPAPSMGDGEGGIGAVRVEVRGTLSGGRRSAVLGSLDRPGVAAAALIAEIVVVLMEPTAPGGVMGPGRLIDGAEMLRRLRARGVRVAELASDLPADPAA
ncbi:MAG: hypothetical protein ACK5O2_04315 [Microthrixaceae bacterium]